MKTLKIAFIFLALTLFVNNAISQEVVKKMTRKERRQLKKQQKKKTITKIAVYKPVKKVETKKKFVDAYTKSQTPENQKKLECKLFHLIIQNVNNKYTYLTGNEINDNSLFKHHYYKKQIPNRFIKHYIDKKYGVFNLTVYNGYNLNSANKEFEALIQDWKTCINKDKTVIFVSKKNNLESSIIGKREMVFTTLRDRIIIKFKINKTIDFKNNKKLKYDVNVSFSKIKDK